MGDKVDVHLERYLGHMDRGWQPVGEPVGVQVCLFAEQPIPGVVSYSTLGLSRHVLSMPGGRAVRQELLFATHQRFEDENSSKLLFHVADAIIRAHRAVLRGEIIHLGYPICRGSRCHDLYVSLPVVFPEGFDTFSGTDPPTVFAWLFPITEGEKTMICTEGWSRFEDELERRDPDLFDLMRESIIQH